MNVEIGTEAAQFPEKDYINGIFVAAQQREQAEEVDKEQTSRHMHCLLQSWGNSFSSIQTLLCEIWNDTRKRIFGFCQKFSQRSWKNFLAQFPNPWALRVSGMGSKCETNSKSLHPTPQCCLLKFLTNSDLMHSRTRSTKTGFFNQVETMGYIRWLFPHYMGTCRIPSSVE